MLQDIPDVTHHARPIFSAGLARAGVDLIEVEGGVCAGATTRPGAKFAKTVRNPYMQSCNNALKSLKRKGKISRWIDSGQPTGSLPKMCKFDHQKREALNARPPRPLLSRLTSEE